MMKERARFMTGQPGFMSVNLHRSRDGGHLVNYIQWQNLEQLMLAQHSPEFRRKWPGFGELARDIAPRLYEVVFSEAAPPSV